MFAAKIVADSRSFIGNHRLTSFVVTFPRIILAEFNTHRMLSKNSASSRAIPYKKALKAVMENPFIPIAWQKDHSGMQGTEYLDPNKLYSFEEVSLVLNDIIEENFKDENGNSENYWKETRDVFYTNVLPRMSTLGMQDKLTITNWWLKIRDLVVSASLMLHAMGVTKQICNRLLEPFMWHTVIVTGTEWANFFGLRVHGAAEIHMQKIADMMLDRYNESTPKLLMPGEWHIPYEREIEALLPSPLPVPENWSLTNYLNKIKVKMGTVMAARTSYTVVGADQKPMTWDRMEVLHDDMRDANPKHMSPFEHCGQSMSEDDYQHSSYNDDDGEDGTWGWSGNFRGFTQYRKMIAYENIESDARIKRKS